MRVERYFNFLLLALLGVSSIINLYAPLYPPENRYFLGGIFQDVLFGMIASLVMAGLFLAAWRKGLPPGQTLWQSLNLTQKGLLGFCAVGLVRGAVPLVLIQWPSADWVYIAVPVLQVAGSAALALMIAPVMLTVYHSSLAGIAEQSLRVQVEAVSQAALLPVSAVSVIIFLVTFFTLGTKPGPFLYTAQRAGLLIVALLILVISLLRLRERKIKWVIFTAGSALAAAYSLYWLLS